MKKSDSNTLSLVTTSILGRTPGPALALLALMVSLLFPSISRAELFQVGDQNPLVIGYGLPLLSTSDLPGNGQWQGAFAYNVSNTLIIEGGSADASDYLLIDGETAVLDMQFLRGEDDRWAWGVHLPFIQHSGGELDGFIENYHDSLGLPEGNRPRVTQDRLAFIFRHKGKELLNLSEARSGLGDIGLLLAYQWRDNDGNKLALHAKLKLPTGNAQHLTGSGGIDYANWLTLEHELATHWVLAGYFGFILLETGDILPTLQKNHTLFGGAGLEWSFSPTLTFRLQADLHTGFYRETDFRFLNEALIFNMGGSINIAERVSLDIAVGEDVMVGASPDVSLHAGLRFQW